MHYGAMIRCLENFQEWKITRIINVKDKMYYEIVIAIGRNADGLVIDERTILSSDVYTKIVNGRYSYFVDLDITHNNIRVFDESGNVIHTFNPLITIDEELIKAGIQRIKRRENI